MERGARIVSLSRGHVSWESWEWSGRTAPCCRAVFERRLFALARAVGVPPRSELAPTLPVFVPVPPSSDAGGESGLDEVSRLRAAMDQAIEEEDYETAASIRPGEEADGPGAGAGRGSEPTILGRV